MLVKSTSQRFLLGKPHNITCRIYNTQQQESGKKMSFYCFQPQIYYCTNLLHCLEEARTVCVCVWVCMSVCVCVWAKKCVLSSSQREWEGFPWAVTWLGSAKRGASEHFHGYIRKKKCSNCSSPSIFEPLQTDTFFYPRDVIGSV